MNFYKVWDVVRCFFFAVAACSREIIYNTLNKEEFTYSYLTSSLLYTSYKIYIQLEDHGHIRTTAHLTLESTYFI